MKSTVILIFVHVFLVESRPNARNASFEESELIFATVIFRHGDRNPLVSYPTDPWADESNWPGGYGHLTNPGKRRHYELGKELRKRYNSLLGNGSYSPNTVYIQCTDIDRTLMSAASNLAGLFPPEGDEVWNENLLWQPIPIHTIPKSFDYILHAEAHCPKFLETLEEYKQTPAYQDLFVKHKSLIKYLEENAGKPFTNLIDIQNLNNTLFIQSITNKTLPEWTKKVLVPGNGLEILCNECFATNTSTPELARLKVGFLLRDIIDRFDQKIESKLNPDRTLWLYSAHDSTIVSVLNSLGLYKLHSPPYASSLHFELYRSSEEFYFQLFYRKWSFDDLTPLNIPLCGTKCSIEKFRIAYSDIIPTGSFQDECEL